MTAFDYGRTKATADRLIARFGQAGTLRRPTVSGSAYNPTPGPPDDHACTFAVMDYSAREIDGARVLASDRKVYLAKGDLSIEPMTSDKLLIGGVEHQIIRVTTTAPSGIVVMYELQVRR